MKDEEKYSKRIEDLFDKIKSRRMNGVFNNRHSKMKSKERYWVVVFSNALDYEFKESQKKWYLKFWIWDSYDRVILGENILAPKDTFDKDSLWTKIYNIILFKNKAENFIIFNGDSKDVLVYDFSGKLCNVLVMGNSSVYLSISRLSQNSLSDDIVVISGKNGHIRARIYDSILSKHCSVIKLKGNLDNYDIYAEFLKISNNVTSAYLVTTNLGYAKEFVIYYFTNYQYNHGSPSYGYTLVYDLYHISSEHKHKVAMNIKDPGDGTLDLTIKSGKYVIQTKLFANQ